jgi:hypothetical protein
VAPGAPPTIVREEINETFVDETLSEACGVTANVQLTGFAIVREREGGGVLEGRHDQCDRSHHLRVRELPGQGCRL